MTYVKQTWHDLPTQDTPITAARLGHVEDGVYAGHHHELVPWPGAGVDAYDAWQAAIAAVEASNAGGVVLLEPGKNYTLDKSGSPALLLGRNNDGSRGWVRIDLNGSTVTLSANTSGFLRFSRVADYDTFQKVEICNGTIDKANVSTTSAAVIEASNQQRVNYDRIYIHDIETLNVPAAVSHSNITLNSVHVGASETQTTTTRIRIERCHFNGGAVGIQVNGGGPAVDGINHFLDDIVVDGIKHYVTPWDSAMPSAFAMAGIHLGSRGKGGRARIRNCHGYGHKDVFIETNAWDDMVVENCHCRNSSAVAFFHRNYSTPPNPKSQRLTYRNISCSFMDTDSGGHYAVAISNSSAPVVAHGDIVIDGASFYRNIPSTAQTQDTLRPFIDCNGTFRSLTISNVDCSLTFGQWTGNTTPVATALTVRGITSAGDVCVRGLNSRVAFTHNATNANTHHVFLNGLLGMVELENVNAATSIASSAADTPGIVYIGNTTTSATTVITGLKLDRIKWREAPNGSAATAIRVKGSELTLPGHVLLRDSDFSTMTAGTAITFDSAGVNTAGWMLRGNRFRAGDTSTNALVDYATRLIAPQPLVGYQAMALTANRAYAMLFTPKEQITVQAISFAVTSASGTDDPCDVGIYTAAASPVKIVSTGATTGKLNGATGRKTVAITPTTLAADTAYYVVFAANSTATLAMTAGASALSLFLPVPFQTFQNTAYTLPDPLVPGGGIGNVPIVAIET